MELRLDKTTGKVSGTRYYSHGGVLVASGTASGIQFQSSDPNGSAELSINASTQTLAQRRFTPFGQFRGTPTGIWPTDKGFVGGTIDPSGLTNLGARQYDPDTGRFISVDPIFDQSDPQSWNGYAYADNNPTTQSDPSGLHIPACSIFGECGGGLTSNSLPRGGGSGGSGGSAPVHHSCNWWCHTKNVGNAVADEFADAVVNPARQYAGMPKALASGSDALTCSEGNQYACDMNASNPYTSPPDTHIPLGGDTSSPEYKITRLIVRYAPVVLGGAGAARAGLRAGLRTPNRMILE